eukprot:1209002-Rhodomonas_salina.1
MGGSQWSSARVAAGGAGIQGLRATRPTTRTERRRTARRRGVRRKRGELQSAVEKRRRRSAPWPSSMSSCEPGNGMQSRRRIGASRVSSSECDSRPCMLPPRRMCGTIGVAMSERATVQQKTE